jgi:hypothetical protein
MGDDPRRKIIATSTITYAVNGRQYVAVMTGDAQSGTAGLLNVVRTFKPVRGHNVVAARPRR